MKLDVYIRDLQKILAVHGNLEVMTSTVTGGIGGAGEAPDPQIAYIKTRTGSERHVKFCVLREDRPDRKVVRV